MFDYYSYGNWQWFTYNDGDPSNDYPLFDRDTAEAGGRLDFTLTSPTTFDWTLTPLAHPELAATRSGTIESGGPVTWIELQQWNTDSDFYPAMVMDARATDFYIRSIEITSAAPPGVPGDYNDNGTVDAADYVLWRKHLGTNFQLANEVSETTPGSVTPGDYTAWRARFGNTSGSGAGGVAGAVPEPSTFVYFIFAAGLLVWRLRSPKHEAVAEPCLAHAPGRR